MVQDEWGFDQLPVEKDGGAGWQDLYGREIRPETVERLEPSVEFEDELIAELDVLELLKELPEMQRLALQKRMEGIVLTNAEHNALHQARTRLRIWLKTRSQ